MCGSFWTWGSWFRVLSGRLEGRHSALIEVESEGGRWLAPGLPGSAALSDDVAVVGGSEARADAEQGVEGRCGVAAAVPAEHELVEIAAQMGAAQAMEGSERPALQVREHTMDPRQHEMGERCTDDLGLVVVVGQAAINRSSHR